MFFILLFLTIASLIALLYFIGLKIVQLPEAEEIEVYEASMINDKYNQFFEKIKLFLIANSEKIFRRFRIWMLKAENLFATWAEKFYEKRKSYIFAKKLPFLSSPFFIRHKIKNYEETVDILNEPELINEEKKIIANIVDNPKNHILYLKLGLIYYRLKNFEDAKKTFEEALKLNPSCIEAKMWLGKVEKILSNKV